MVGRRDIVDTHDLFWCDVTEHRDLLHGRRQQWFRTSTCNLPCQLITIYQDKTWGLAYKIWEETQSSEIPNTSLRRLRLLLTSDNGDEGNVD